MTHFLSSPARIVHLQNSNGFMIDTVEVRALFQQLRQADLSTSLALRSTWHGSEKIRTTTPC